MIDGAQSYSPKKAKITTIRFFNPRHKQCRGRKLRTYQFVTGAVDEVVPVDGRVPLEAALAEHHVHEGQRTLKSEIVAIFNAATDHLPPKQSVGGFESHRFHSCFPTSVVPLIRYLKEVNLYLGGRGQNNGHPYVLPIAKQTQQPHRE